MRRAGSSRRWTTGPEEAGRHSADWNGEDARGHALRAGCHLVRLTTAGARGGEMQTMKLLLTR